MNRYILSLLLLLGCLSAGAAPITITDQATAGAFPIVSARERAAIIYDAADARVVQIAANAVRDDIRAITGSTLSVRSIVQQAPHAIIAGTIGRSKYIDQLIAEGKVSVTDIKDKWETYAIQLVDAPMDGVGQALVICGANPRATAYGLFELSRLMGVSPYIWWADVAPAKHQELYAVGTRTASHEPSVKYRGLFINDEDWGITPWARKKMDTAKNNIGPNTYARVMELLLRLRANTLWPAMHGCSAAFFYYPENIAAAKRYDIVLGSSHCESMMRNNVWEWNRYGGHGNDDWNYRTNTAMVQRYWADRVGQARDMNVMYTLGMRGVHDTGINGYSSTADKVKGLTDIIAYQRRLISDSIGDPTRVPQIFIPYKEVLDAYNAGLKVPDDVTLCWVDDNHGYIRQMPTPEEQARSGGNGIYYHLSYLGTPASYLWLCSTSPSLISYELSKGYANGIRNLWIINVGDIKPAEMELEFCMDLAWDVDAWTPTRAYTYARHWAAKTFGDAYADDLAAIKAEYYALAAAGKPELINRIAFTDAERTARVARYEALKTRVDALKARIPATLQDAYFEMIEYPVKGAADMNIKMLRSEQSFDYAKAGNATRSAAYAAASTTAFNDIVSRTDTYNKVTAGGKWDGMMSYRPGTGGPMSVSVFSQQPVATTADVAPYRAVVYSPDRTYYQSTAYTSASPTVCQLQGLGLNGQSVGVWPLDMTAYATANYSRAPWTKYTVHMKRGLNTLVVRCLPSFPVNATYDLRVGVKMAGGAFRAQSVKTTAMSGKWNRTVADGFSDAIYTYNATADRDVEVTVYFMDPGVVLSDLYVEHSGVEDRTLTDKLLVNADFEYNADNKKADGRGIPYGWTVKGTLSGNSYGVNTDAKNPHGTNCCWFNSKPFPDEFELSQTIPAGKIEPGLYRVSCLFWNQSGNGGNSRIFANNSVQYFGTAMGVQNILTPGELNSYANYEGTPTSDIYLKPMYVYVQVHEGESLTIGVRSSNRKNNGSVATGNDPTGWFKVDNFMIERIEPVTDGIRQPGTTTAQRDRGIYTLHGQRVGTTDSSLPALPSGVYIVGGRKVVK